MMSDRERWIVYPLLFLAIGLGVKGQWPQASDLQCRSIRCNELMVEALDGSARVRVGSGPAQSGEIRLYGATGQIAMALGTDTTGERGVIQTLDDQRNRRAVMGSDTAGGFVRLYGTPEVPSLFLGHDGQHEIFGLLALNDQGKPLVLSHKDRSVLWGLQVPLPRVPSLGEGMQEQPESGVEGEPEPAAPAGDQEEPAGETAVETGGEGSGQSRQVESAEETSPAQEPSQSVEENAPAQQPVAPSSAASEPAQSPEDQSAGSSGASGQTGAGPEPVESALESGGRVPGAGTD